MREEWGTRAFEVVQPISLSGVVSENDGGENDLPLAVSSRPGVGKAGVLDIRLSVIGAGEVHPAAEVGTESIMPKEERGRLN
jgi:hypothetical protein